MLLLARYARSAVMSDHSCILSLADGTCVGIRCHPDAKCEQSAGGVSVCVCKPGYRGDGRECSGKLFALFNMVVMVANCLFVNKVFFRALFPLADIDECFRKDQNCHKEAECVNTVGSFNCSCKLGFEGDGADCKRTMAHCIN